MPDRLRGLALLGIVVVNAPFMAISTTGFTAGSIATWWDRAAAFAVTALAQGKFYLLFSFLFGYSAAFLLRDGGRPRRATYRRRLLGLAAIGFLHAILFFVGDILLSYAVLGIGIVAVYRRSDRVVTAAAIVSMTVATLWLVLLVVASFAADEDPAATSDLFSASIDSLNAALAHGSFLDAALARLRALPTVLLTLGSLNWGFALSAFFVGLLAARRQLLADPAMHERLWRRLALWGIGIGLPLQLVSAAIVVSTLSTDGIATSGANVAGLALGFISAPLLSSGYVGALALLIVHRPTALRWAGAAGRSSLSLYISESVVLSFVYSGYGLGLFGELGALAVTVSAILTWLCLELVARWWLGRNPQGPLEAVLGAWTHGRVFGPQP